MKQSELFLTHTIYEALVLTWKMQNMTPDSTQSSKICWDLDFLKRLKARVSFRYCLIENKTAVSFEPASTELRTLTYQALIPISAVVVKFTPRLNDADVMSREWKKAADLQARSRPMRQQFG